MPPGSRPPAWAPASPSTPTIRRRAAHRTGAWNSSSSSARHGQGKVESRAFALLAFRPNAASVQGHDLAADRKPKPGAFDGAVSQSRPGVAVENLFKHTGLDSDSLVADGDDDLRAFDARLNQDLAAFGRVLDGVAQQVEHDLREAVPIAVNQAVAVGEVQADQVPGGDLAGPLGH